jgi:hypothetical protein
MPQAKKDILDLKTLTDNDLADYAGKVKAIQANAKSEMERVRAEAISRFSRRSKLAYNRGTGYSVEGLLFKLTLTLCDQTTLDIDRIRDYLKSKVAQFERSSQHFKLTVSARTGTGRKEGDAAKSA